MAFLQYNFCNVFTIILKGSLNNRKFQAYMEVLIIVGTPINSHSCSSQHPNATLLLNLHLVVYKSEHCIKAVNLDCNNSLEEIGYPSCLYLRVKSSISMQSPLNNSACVIIHNEQEGILKMLESWNLFSGGQALEE